MLSQPPHQDDSDSQLSPSTPKYEVSPPFISKAEAQLVQNDPTMKPNSTQQSISHCQQQPVLPSELGQRQHIVISDLACDMGVLKSIKAICSDLFSGYPTSYKRLSTQSREAYISRFSLEYTWAPSDNERMVSTLHALFANRYRANFSNLRIAAHDKFIDYAKGQNLDCALVMPFRPEFASPDIWHDLCLLGKLKHNRIPILGEGEVPVITMGRRSKSRRLGEMETRETQERNSQAEALLARKAELRIEFELLMTMQKGFSTQMSNIFNAMVSMGVFNSGGSSSQNQLSPILEQPQPQPPMLKQPQPQPPMLKQPQLQPPMFKQPQPQPPVFEYQLTMMTNQSSSLSQLSGMTYAHVQRNHFPSQSSPNIHPPSLTPQSPSKASSTHMI